MVYQKNIAKQIVDAGGDYLLALKGNQSSLSEQVELCLKKQTRLDTKVTISTITKPMNPTGIGMTGILLTC